MSILINLISPLGLLIHLIIINISRSIDIQVPDLFVDDKIWAKSPLALTLDTSEHMIDLVIPTTSTTSAVATNIYNSVGIRLNSQPDIFTTFSTNNTQFTAMFNSVTNVIEVYEIRELIFNRRLRVKKLAVIPNTCRDMVHLEEDRILLICNQKTGSLDFFNFYFYRFMSDELATTTIQQNAAGSTINTQFTIQSYKTILAIPSSPVANVVMIWIRPILSVVTGSITVQNNNFLYIYDYQNRRLIHNAINGITNIRVITSISSRLLNLYVSAYREIIIGSNPTVVQTIYSCQINNDLSVASCTQRLQINAQTSGMIDLTKPANQTDNNMIMMNTIAKSTTENILQVVKLNLATGATSLIQVSRTIRLQSGTPSQIDCSVLQCTILYTQTTLPRIIGFDSFFFDNTPAKLNNIHPNENVFFGIRRKISATNLFNLADTFSYFAHEENVLRLITLDSQQDVQTNTTGQAVGTQSLGIRSDFYNSPVSSDPNSDPHNVILQIGSESGLQNPFFPNFDTTVYQTYNGEFTRVPINKSTMDGIDLSFMLTPPANVTHLLFSTNNITISNLAALSVDRLYLGSVISVGIALNENNISNMKVISCIFQRTQIVTATCQVRQTIKIKGIVESTTIHDQRIANGTLAPGTPVVVEEQVMHKYKDIGNYFFVILYERNAKTMTYYRINKVSFEMTSLSSNREIITDTVDLFNYKDEAYITAYEIQRKELSVLRLDFTSNTFSEVIIYSRREELDELEFGPIKMSIFDPYCPKIAYLDHKSNLSDNDKIQYVITSIFPTFEPNLRHSFVFKPNESPFINVSSSYDGISESCVAGEYLIFIEISNQRRLNAINIYNGDVLRINLPVLNVRAARVECYPLIDYAVVFGEQATLAAPSNGNYNTSISILRLSDLKKRGSRFEKTIKLQANLACSGSPNYQNIIFSCLNMTTGVSPTPEYFIHYLDKPRLLIRAVTDLVHRSQFRVSNQFQSQVLNINTQTTIFQNALNFESVSRAVIKVGTYLLEPTLFKLTGPVYDARLQKSDINSNSTRLIGRVSQAEMVTANKSSTSADIAMSFASKSYIGARYVRSDNTSWVEFYKDPQTFRSRTQINATCRTLDVAYFKEYNQTSNSSGQGIRKNGYSAVFCYYGFQKRVYIVHDSLSPSTNVINSGYYVTDRVATKITLEAVNLNQIAIIEYNSHEQTLVIRRVDIEPLIQNQSPNIMRGLTVQFIKEIKRGKFLLFLIYQCLPTPCSPTKIWCWCSTVWTNPPR